MEDVATGIILENNSSGKYVRGRKYGIETKHRVVEIFIELKWENGGNDPRHIDVAKRAGVSKSYVANVMQQTKENGGDVVDTQQPKQKRQPKYRKLVGEDAIFLLALRAEDDRRYLKDYKKILLEEKGVKAFLTLTPTGASLTSSVLNFVKINCWYQTSCRT